MVVPPVRKAVPYDTLERGQKIISDPKPGLLAFFEGGFLPFGEKFPAASASPKIRRLRLPNSDSAVSADSAPARRG